MPTMAGGDSSDSENSEATSSASGSGSADKSDVKAEEVARKVEGAI